MAANTSEMPPGSVGMPLPKPKGTAPLNGASPANELAPPQVRTAVANSTLPPMTSTAGTDVIITAAIPAGVRINVFWAIMGKETSPLFTGVAPSTGSAGMMVAVPAWVIGYCIGKTLVIWYETEQDTSQQLVLTVEVIDPRDLPVSTFLDQVFFEGSWWLNMTTFAGDASVQLCAWPFIAAGQRLWIGAVGNEHLSPRRFTWILEGYVVTADDTQDGFCFLSRILREWLSANEDWSSVTVHAGVTFDGAEGSLPADPSISLLPANAHELPRATALLRISGPELYLPRRLSGK